MTLMSCLLFSLVMDGYPCISLDGVAQHTHGSLDIFRRKIPSKYRSNPEDELFLKQTNPSDNNPNPENSLSLK